MDDTETINRRPDQSMTTPEPSTQSNPRLPHARLYRPFRRNGPYGAHRLYSYWGPWMPPIDYGVGPEQVRYRQRLYRFYGLWLGALFLLIPYLCLLGDRLLAVIPGIGVVSRVMDRVVPIIDIVAGHYPDSAATAAAMSVNLIVLTILAAIVVGLRWRALTVDGYSDISIALYNSTWRRIYGRQEPVANGRLAYRVSNQLGLLSLILVAPSIIASLWSGPHPYLHILDMGIFDGRAFTNKLFWNGPFSFLKDATHSHAALLALMFLQNGFVYVSLVGLLYCCLWPCRRAAYLNDQAYLQARVASGLDNPDPRHGKIGEI